MQDTEVVVFTNGCFDLLHAGHVAYLRAARKLGTKLIVWLNTDESVRALKGPSRPLQPYEQRELVLRELRCVDAVWPLSDTDMVNVLMTKKCHVWAKGGDYQLETLNQAEVEAARTRGIALVLIPCCYDIHISTMLRMRPQ